MSFPALPPVWHTCFALAWQAHLGGSNPIAAVVADSDGQIVATGQSSVHAELPGVTSVCCEIAHAEVNALLALDNRVHTKARALDYSLYVTLEPCPLCFSAFYMSDVGTLVYAARDRFGGSTNLLGTTPYLSRKQRTIEGPNEDLGGLSIFLNVYSDLLRGVGVADVLHDAFAQDYPRAVAQARALAPTDELDIATCPDVDEVLERIFEALN